MPTDKFPFVLVKGGLLDEFSPGAGVEVDFLDSALFREWDDIEGDLFGMMGVTVDDILNAVALQVRFVVGKSPVVVGLDVDIANQCVPKDIFQARRMRRKN